jgi:hypothetical protein
MGRIILVYGLIAGGIVAVGMALGITLVPDGGTAGMVAGYLSMLIALSMVFVGVRQYRDAVRGGTVRFWPALGVGLGIACIACLSYVLAWEAYLAMSDTNYIAEYARQTLATMRAEGRPAAEIAQTARELADFEAQYAQPLFRTMITFSEIAPVGLLVALVSAALLRNSAFLPAKAPRAG